jgi:hypothetical protein
MDLLTLILLNLLIVGAGAYVLIGLQVVAWLADMDDEPVGFWITTGRLLAWPQMLLAVLTWVLDEQEKMKRGE